MSGRDLVPLIVAIPLLGAALIVITSKGPRRLHDVLATTAAVAVVVLCAIVLADARNGPVVEWLGGWRPHHHVALGVALGADQLGAGMALLVAVLASASLVYSWAYFEELDGLVHALILVLTAAMAGFALSGDLFTMVVFFVLMSVSAIGLTAVENEHGGPLQGAINFSVVNSIAGFALLVGAGLVYGRTGALNLSQIALSLDRHPADALVAVGFALLAFGFLTKAGAAPFHFWAPDAHAVAPTPVCSLFAGAMVTTALFGVARILNTAFALTLSPHIGGVRGVLVGIGALTALIGAVGCWEQRHVKRMVAFAGVSTVGVMLCGVGLLRADALAGAALGGIGYGLALAALLGCCGVLLRRYETIDEYDLMGRANDLPITGAVFFTASLALAGLPPALPFYARWLVDDGARAAGYGWLPPLLAASSALVTATLLRTGARVFFGWGSGERADPRVASEERSQQRTAAESEDDSASGERPSPLLVLIPAGLVLVVFLIGLAPGFVPSVEVAAAHFRDVHAYIAAVLDDVGPRYGAVVARHVDATGWWYALASVGAAPVVAAVSLRGRRLLPESFSHTFRGLHSGHVGDYVAWWTLGVAVLGGLVLWAIAG